MRLFKSKMKLFIIPLTALLLILSFSGCGEDVATPQENVDFSYQGSGDSTGDMIDILDLNEVKILIKDIKLNVASSSEDSVNFKVGPYVLVLNLKSEVNLVTSAYIPPGNYDKVRFMVHKLGDNETPPDPDFADANGRYSVVAKGTFNGIDFVFKSDKSAHQKLTFPASLFVTASGKSNITLQVKPYIWFIKNGLYLDPMNPINTADIDNNIKDNINGNFKIFVDNDRNGKPD
ncbi:MAG: hypothetical protein L0Y79_12605 [Chlorobi bacterium]|nr:hypothetical protein [Chlorobiota bacterium]MCI0715521.1 hypothetical protein [Chlorobiota bacterium]